MPPEILRLPTTDLITNGTVRSEDVTPVDEKARPCPARRGCRAPLPPRTAAARARAAPGRPRADAPLPPPRRRRWTSGALG